MADLSNEQLRGLQFRRMHEMFMRAEGFTGWTWPDPPELVRSAEIANDMFEEWLIARWLREIRSDSFRRSVQYERLRAEWEREQ